MQPIDLTNPNRFHVRFALDGDVWLTQQKRIPNTPDWGIARWSLRLERQQIERSTAFEEFVNGVRHCYIVILANGPPSFTGDISTILNSIKTDRFPLALAAAVWTAGQIFEIELEFENLASIRPVGKYHINIVQALLRGPRPLSKSVDLHLWHEANVKAAAFEQQVAVAGLAWLKDCVGHLVIVDRGILVKITKAGAIHPNAFDEAFSLRHRGKRFPIRCSSSPEIPNAEALYISDEPESNVSGIVGAVVHYPEHSDCNFQVLIQAQVPPNRRAEYDGLILHGIICSPVHRNQKNVYMKGPSDLVQLEAIQRLLSTPSYQGRAISERRLFMRNEPPITELVNDNVIPEFRAGESSTAELSVTRRRKKHIPYLRMLDAVQCLAVDTASSRKVTCVIGPPGSGKTTTLIGLICCRLLEHSGEKMLVLTSSESSASQFSKLADQAMIKCGIIDDREHSDDEADLVSLIVQVCSEKSIEDAYNLGTPSFDRHHIQRLRTRLANELSCPWRGLGKNEFLHFKHGVSLLERHGWISESQTYAEYAEERNQLTQIILGHARVVLAAFHDGGCQSIREYYPVDTLIMDEVGRAKLQDLCIPLLANRRITRLILAGDHSQPGPLILSREAQTTWEPHFFSEIATTRGFPCLLFDVNHATHDRLFAHTNDIWYGGRIRSSLKTTDPAPFLATFMQQLPLDIRSNNGTYYRCNNFTHFFDVSNGQTQKVTNGSSWNEAEAELAISLVRTLLYISGVKHEHFMLLSVHQRQIDFVTTLAAKRGLHGLKAMLIDEAMGQYAEIVVMMTVRDAKTLEGNTNWRSLEKSSRLNLATSRAKSAFFMIGNGDAVWPDPGATIEDKIDWVAKYLSHEAAAFADFRQGPRVSG